MSHNNIGLSMQRELTARDYEGTEAQNLNLGYLSRYLAQVSLPHSKSDSLTFKRSNGILTLSVQADPDFGLPYGTYPRLLLAWICSQAVKTQSPKLELGSNQSEFLSKLELSHDGRRISALKDQTSRLLNSVFRFTIEQENSRTRKNLLIADSTFELWENQGGAWETHLTLSTDFFHEIVANPSPINLNVLNAIRKSPLAMDVYTWLAYRSYSIYVTGNQPVKIPWISLQNQFGASYGQPTTELLTADKIIQIEAQGVRDFKRKFLIALRNLSRYYPEIDKIIEEDSRFLTLKGAKLI